MRAHACMTGMPRHVPVLSKLCPVTAIRKKQGCRERFQDAETETKAENGHSENENDGNGT